MKISATFSSLSDIMVLTSKLSRRHTSNKTVVIKRTISCFQFEIKACITLQVQLENNCHSRISTQNVFKDNVPLIRAA